MEVIEESQEGGIPASGVTSVSMTERIRDLQLYSKRALWEHIVEHNALHYFKPRAISGNIVEPSANILSSHSSALANRVGCQAPGKLAGIGIRYNTW